MKKWEIGRYANQPGTGATLIHRNIIEADEMAVKDDLVRFFRREEGHSHELIAIFRDFDFVKLKEE